MRTSTPLAACLALVLALAPALSVTPRAASAQTAQRWSIQISGIGNLVGDFSDGELDPGGGGELQIRITPGALSFGLGLESIRQQGSRSCDVAAATDICFDEDVEVEVTGLFVEPRLTFPVASSTALYLSGRFGASTIRRTSEMTQLYHPDPDTQAALREAATGTDTDGEWSGWTANVGGGLLIRLTDRVNLDLGLTVGRKGFGAGSITGTLPSGEEFPIAEDIELGVVNNAVVRVGVAIGLGGG